MFRQTCSTPTWTTASAIAQHGRFKPPLNLVGSSCRSMTPKMVRSGISPEKKKSHAQRARQRAENHPQKSPRLASSHPPVRRRRPGLCDRSPGRIEDRRRRHCQSHPVITFCRHARHGASNEKRTDQDQRASASPLGRRRHTAMPAGDPQPVSPHFFFAMTQLLHSAPAPDWYSELLDQFSLIKLIDSMPSQYNVHLALPGSSTAHESLHCLLPGPPLKNGCNALE